MPSPVLRSNPASQAGVATRWFSRTTLFDDDGLKNSVATSTSAALYSGSALDGAEANLLKGGKGPGRTISVTTSTQTGAYTAGSKVTITGKVGDRDQVEVLTITQANGNEAIHGTKAFDTVTSVAIEPQALGTGTIKLGVGDVCAPDGGTFRFVMAGAAGAVQLVYDENDSALDDTVTLLDRQVFSAAFMRVKRATAIAVSIGF